LNLQIWETDFRNAQILRVLKKECMHVFANKSASQKTVCIKVYIAILFIIYI